MKNQLKILLFILILSFNFGYALAEDPNSIKGDLLVNAASNEYKITYFQRDKDIATGELFMAPFSCSIKGNLPDGAIMIRGKLNGEDMRIEQPIKNNAVNGNFKMYRNDILISETIMETNFANGYARQYDVKTGKLTGEGMMVDGLKNGAWKEYGTYMEKPIKLTGNYINDLKDGVWKIYYENNSLFREENYVAGLLDGDIKQYWRNTGVLSYKIYYENGKQVRQVSYDEYGKELGNQSF